MARRSRPVTIALRAVGPASLCWSWPTSSAARCARGARSPCCIRSGRAAAGSRDQPRADAVARFGPLVERCELDHDHVIMLCGSGEATSAWDEFCMSRADRVLAVVGEAAPRAAETTPTSEDGMVAPPAEL